MSFFKKLGVLPFLLIGILLFILGLLTLNSIVNSWWPFNVERIDLVRAVTTGQIEAATLLDEGKVKHVASGKTIIGSWTSCSTDLAEECLTKGGFDVEVTLSPGQTIWEKAVINAGINPITAILDITNNQISTMKHARQLMRDLVVEAAKVASTEGYRYDYSLVEKAEEMCEQTGENISSMLQDVRLGKSTEIDAISGEILRRAELASLNIPRTRVVWQIIKGLEQR